MKYASRPVQLPDDLSAIADLSLRSEQIDELDFLTSEAALAGMFARPSLDLQHDARLWYDASENLVAFSLLDQRAHEEFIDGVLWMRFLPAARTAALFMALVDWGAVRLQAIGAARRQTTRLYCAASSNDAWRISQLEAQRFQPIRHFLRMERDLAAPFEPPVLPAGYSLRAVAGPDEAAAWVECFNASFVDHWNFHPLTVELLRTIWAEPLYRRDLDLIAVAPDGSLAAFCSCEIEPDDPDHAGWIEVLGTRRSHRRHGLGRAMLAGGLTCLRNAGAHVARLNVDVDSPTGATRLYEAAGFRVSRRSIRFVR